MHYLRCDFISEALVASLNLLVNTASKRRLIMNEHLVAPVVVERLALVMNPHS